MTKKKETDKIVKRTADDIIASRAPSVVEQAALARETSLSRAAGGLTGSAVERAALGQETAVSRAVRDLTDFPTSALLKAQFKSPLAELIEGSKTSLLASGILESNQLSASAEAARGISQQLNLLNGLGSAQWKRELLGFDTSIIHEVARQQSGIAKALAGITDNLSATTKALEFGMPNLSAHVEAAIASFSSLNLTNQRFAALAGITDTYGLGSLHRQTFETLLGQWHTAFDLPKNYWRDFDYRRELYREAEVDEGLIEADPETTIELAISSGAIVGEIIEEGHYIVGKTASGILTLTTSNLATDIFELVGTIETALRRLIVRKLNAHAGHKWFKQRVPGALNIKAKDTRQRALKAGEPLTPLIEFLTLGELMEIVLKSNNWDEVFEPIFRNRDWFKRDIEVIGVARNPNAHYRANDGLRLTEAMIVWQRLSSYIEDDGQWAVDADADK
ncbi:MAG: hypothetical protein V7676_00380 [Parasphingorhabdus sp.]|uniref:hypothetical protein n=1 Tax=Parasphingorhabdus sp. TaxID=2709688 RepID=UPI003001B05A